MACPGLSTKRHTETGLTHSHKVVASNHETSIDHLHSGFLITSIWVPTEMHGQVVIRHCECLDVVSAKAIGVNDIYWSI